MEEKINFRKVTAFVMMLVGILTIISAIFMPETYTKLMTSIEPTKKIATFLNIQQVTLLAIITGIIYFIDGYLVNDRYKEGMYISVVLGILFLFAFPIGTIIGLITIYTMLFSKDRYEFTREIKL